MRSRFHKWQIATPVKRCGSNERGNVFSDKVWRAFLPILLLISVHNILTRCCWFVHFHTVSQEISIFDDHYLFIFKQNMTYEITYIRTVYAGAYCCTHVNRKENPIKSSLEKRCYQICDKIGSPSRFYCVLWYQMYSAVIRGVLRWGIYKPLKQDTVIKFRALKCTPYLQHVVPPKLWERLYLATSIGVIEEGLFTAVRHRFPPVSSPLSSTRFFSKSICVEYLKGRNQGLLLQFVLSWTPSAGRRGGREGSSF